MPGINSPTGHDVSRKQVNRQGTLPPPASPAFARRTRERAGVALGALVLTVLALLTYQPWTTASFEFFDFGDFLPTLRAGRDFASRHELLTEFYLRHGRYFPLTVLYHNAKWTWFGWDVVAWQWINMALMGLNTALAYIFLRRVGASVLGAFVGAAGFIVFASASSVWQRVHTSQAQGLPFFLAAAILTLGIRTSARPVVRAAGAGALTALAILSKETFVAVVPFLCLLAACQEAGRRWHAPVMDRRSLSFVLLVGGAALAAIAPVLYFKAIAPPSAYADMYTADTIDARAIVLKFRTMMLPMGDSIRRWAPDAVFVVLVAVGLRARRRLGADRGEWWLIATALSLPLAGALVHLPWPGHGPHYASSYILGPAMLLALAATGATGSPGALRPAAYAALAYLGLYGTLRAREEFDNFVSMRKAHAAFVTQAASLVHRSGAREVIVAVRSTEDYCFNCVLLTDMGRAFLHTPLPPVRPVRCEDLPGILALTTPAVIAEEQGVCPPIATPPAAATLQVVRHQFTGRPGAPDSIRLQLRAAGVNLRPSHQATSTAGRGAAP